MTGRGAADRLRRAMLLLCRDLTRPWSGRERLPRPDDRILLIRPDHLGDVLFTTPALRRLREQYPKAHITYLAGPWSEPIVGRNPNIDEVIFVDFPWFNGRPAPNPIQPYVEMVRLARKLRTQHFAVSVNLRFDFWWGAAAAYLAGIPFRLGYATDDCRPFLHKALTHRKGRHEVNQNLDLIDVLVRLGDSHRPTVDYSNGITSQFPLEFPVSAAEREFASNYLAARGIGERDRLIVVHPGTRAAIKRWPAERFAAVANALAHGSDARVLLTGSAEERPLTTAIARHMAVPAINAVGDTTLGQLAALFERARVVLGVDSGPLHLAVAVNTPTVHLFGPSDHIAFGPYAAIGAYVDAGRHAVVRADLNCSPCGRLDRSNSALSVCMEAITVERVLQAAQRVLS